MTDAAFAPIFAALQATNVELRICAPGGLIAMLDDAPTLMWIDAANEGPPEFPGLVDALAQCRAAAILETPPHPAVYTTVTAVAVMGHHAAIIQTCPEHFAAWVELAERLKLPAALAMRKPASDTFQ